MEARDRQSTADAAPSSSMWATAAWLGSQKPACTEPNWQKAPTTPFAPQRRAGSLAPSAWPERAPALAVVADARQVAWCVQVKRIAAHCAPGWHKGAVANAAAWWRRRELDAAAMPAEWRQRGAAGPPARRWGAGWEVGRGHTCCFVSRRGAHVEDDAGGRNHYQHLWQRCEAGSQGGASLHFSRLAVAHSTSAYGSRRHARQPPPAALAAPACRPVFPAATRTRSGLRATHRACAGVAAAGWLSADVGLHRQAHTQAITRCCWPCLTHPPFLPIPETPTFQEEGLQMAAGRQATRATRV